MMNKGILVLDMPKNCLNCPLASWATCRITKKCHTGYFRPDYCPLKVPEKKDSAQLEKYSLEIIYAEGYNACVDDILKGSEENG